MVRRWTALVGFAAVGLISCAGVLAARHVSRMTPPPAPAATPARADAASALRRLPLIFERNDGQLPTDVRFAGLQSGGTIAIHDDGFSIADARFTFVNASRGHATGVDRRRTRSNYFTGNDRRAWRTGIPTFGRVRREHLYPHIDVVYYGRERQLEYDLVVRPGGDPRQVALRVDGGRMRVDAASGDLVVEQDGRDLRHQRPVAYQEIRGARRGVAAHYVVEDDRVGIVVGSYDRTADLVIDPIIAYSTLLGIRDFAVDTSGHIYVVSSTNNRADSAQVITDLTPVTRTFGTSGSGIYVARIAASGVDLDFSTFIGTASDNTSSLVAVDGSGAVYVAGYDDGQVAPITLGRVGPHSGRSFLTALTNDGGTIIWSRYVADGSHVGFVEPRPAGGVALAGVLPRFGFRRDPFGAPATIGTERPDAPWVLKVDANGGGERPAYLGTVVEVLVRGMAVGPDDTVSLAGVTGDFRLPLTDGNLQTMPRGGQSGGFLTRFNQAQDGYAFSTYISPSERGNFVAGLAVDAAGSTYLTGLDGAQGLPGESTFPSTGEVLGTCPVTACARLFVMKILASGALAFSRQFSLSVSSGHIGVTPAGEAIVAFEILGEGLPVVSPLSAHSADQGFDFSYGDLALVKFSADGKRLLFSTYFGGNGGETPTKLRVDPSGHLYFQGRTRSSNFPLRNARRTTLLKHFGDDFLTKILMRGPTRADFDGDARTDVSIFRPSTGEWIINTGGANTGTTTLGQSGDIPAAADFNGDDRTDLAVFRPSNGQWFIRHTSDGTQRTVLWGGSTADIPVPADYDGDGRADIAFFRPSNGYWYILQSSTNTGRYVQWGGTASDVPAPGDYDGDGRADVAFFRPSDGYWFLNRSSAGIQYVQWGGTLADIPVPGDYDGDRQSDVAFWRPSDNYWYIRLTATGAARYVRWGGTSGDIPTPGDYDQDDITDPAFFRPGDGYWYILQSRTRTARYVNLGTAGDIPIPSRR